MDTLEKLNEQFGIEGQLTFVHESGDHILIEIDNEYATAKISLHGGQVLSYQPHGEAEDLLFLSDKAYFQKGEAIRGGVPICWPWFGDDTSGQDLPAHGFARNLNWSVLGITSTSDGSTTISLILSHSEITMAIWPYQFELVLEISIGKTLGLKLITKNLGKEQFSITQALHTYLQVGDIAKVAVKALDGVDYMDKVDGQRKTQQGDVIVAEEVDRIYQSHPEQLILVDHDFNREIVISSKGNQTAVIWNPWVDLATSMADLKNSAYQHFLCVEAVNVVEDEVIVLSNEQSCLQTEYSINRH